jgi:hypothetical protein
MYSTSRVEREERKIKTGISTFEKRPYTSFFALSMLEKAG